MKISAHKAQCLTGSRCNSIDVVVPFQVMLDVNTQVSVSLCFLQHCVSKGVVGYDWRSRRFLQISVYLLKHLLKVMVVSGFYGLTINVQIKKNKLVVPMTTRLQFLVVRQSFRLSIICHNLKQLV